MLRSALRILRKPLHLASSSLKVTQEADGGYVAECLTETLATQGDTWDELRANVKEAVEGYFFYCPRPPIPAHKTLRIGTLNAILRFVADHKVS